MKTVGKTARPAPLGEENEGNDARRTIPLFGRQMPLPRSRRLRIVLGAVLIVFGCFGFLPVLGFWMIPLGLLVLSYEFAMVRRYRRRSAVWWGRRRRR
jgi:hypothetical protein